MLPVKWPLATSLSIICGGHPETCCHCSCSNLGCTLIHPGSSHISLRANDTSPKILERIFGCVWQVAMHLDVPRRSCALRRLDPQSPPSVKLPAAPSALSIGQNHQTTKAWWKLQGTVTSCAHTRTLPQALSGALKVSLYSRPISSDRSFEVYCVKRILYTHIVHLLACQVDFSLSTIIECVPQ